MARPGVSVVVPFLGTADDGAADAGGARPPAARPRRRADRRRQHRRRRRSPAAATAGSAWSRAPRPALGLSRPQRGRGRRGLRRAGCCSRRRLRAARRPPRPPLGARARARDCGVVAGEARGAEAQTARSSPAGRGRGVGRSPPTSSTLGPRPAGTTANLLVRRDAFEAVGGFCEVRSDADVELCWRHPGARPGARVPARDAIVAHRDPEAVGDVVRQAAGYGAGRRWLRARPTARGPGADAGAPARAGRRRDARLDARAAVRARRVQARRRARRGGDLVSATGSATTVRLAPRASGCGCGPRPGDGGDLDQVVEDEVRGEQRAAALDLAARPDVAQVRVGEPGAQRVPAGRQRRAAISARKSSQWISFQKIPKRKLAPAELAGGGRRRSSASSSAPRPAACRAARGRRPRGGRAPRREDGSRPGLDRAPGEVAVLAAGLAAEGRRRRSRRRAPAAPAGRRCCRSGTRGRARPRRSCARTGPSSPSSAGFGQRPALDEAARARRARRARLAPSQPGVGAQSSSVNAISVGLGRAPAVVARGRRAALDRARRSCAAAASPRARSAASTASVGGRGAVGDHDDLVGGPLLLGQRAQQLGEPARAIVRRDDDRDRRSHGRNA